MTANCEENHLSKMKNNYLQYLVVTWHSCIVQVQL